MKIYFYAPGKNCQTMHSWSEVFTAIALVPDCYSIYISAATWTIQVHIA